MILKIFIRNKKMNLFLRSLKYLKTIIGVSGGIIFITPLLLGYSIDEMIQILLQTNQINLLNYENFSIQILLMIIVSLIIIYLIFYTTILEKYKGLITTH